MTNPTSSLHPTTRRVLGLLLMLCGGLMALGLLIRVVVGAYAWSAGNEQSASALLLSANLVGLLASGLLVRWGLRMRRGTNTSRNPNTDGIL